VLNKLPPLMKNPKKNKNLLKKKKRIWMPEDFSAMTSDQKAI
jgi:hypothetical protein